ncbi:MAG: VanW family protein [Actinomycetota bacterium]
MRRRLVFLLLSIIATAVVLGLVFAGSPTTLANGVSIDGVDVGGMHASAARALLEKRSAALANRPVIFLAGGKRFAIRPAELGVSPDWKAAVDAAQRQGDGFSLLRGFRRIDVQVFGADVTPPTRVLNGALEYKLGLLAGKINRAPRDAAVVRHGTNVVVVPARAGLVLDRRAAERMLVRSLAAIDRKSARVQLPLRVQQPRVRAAALAAAARQARIALSAPVHLQLGKTRWLLQPRRIARLLQLPAGGQTSLQIGGRAADAWIVKLGHRVEQPAKDATFAVHGERVTVVPAQPGVRLDAAGTADVLLGAALKRQSVLRVGTLPVQESQAKLSTKAARAMHITAPVSSYTTIYGGIANRIHNVQLVAHLVDEKLIAPGATFSFNQTTGERNASKGFLEAPVIVNGEVTTGLGGGVCQVSTTVFNAAFEAGLKITERTNHALYISHYPQGRDATVDYPSVDLKFVNDTGYWLLLRTFVSSSSLTVGLYGTPVHRKVESSTSPLVSKGVPPVKKTVDPSLKPGEKIVDDPGVPAMSTSVTRDVYKANGKLLYHDTWYSSYRAEPKLVRLGPAKKKPKEQPGTTTTGTTTTTTTTTKPTG